MWNRRAVLPANGLYEDNEMSVESTKIDVCNEALSKLKNLVGITSLNKASTDPATRACAINFEQCRKSVLASVDWNFARKSLLVENALSIPVPVDSIRVISVLDSCGNKLRFSIFGREIKLNASSDASSVVYTEDLEDISLWSTLARKALVHSIAKEVAEVVTGRVTSWEKHAKELANAIADARLANARESRKSYSDDATDYVSKMLGSNVNPLTEA